MDQGLAAVIGALIGAAGGGFIAYLQLRVNKVQQHQAAQERKEQREQAIQERQQATQERQRDKRDTYLFEALKWFTGGTQKRNVGISIVEGYWTEIPHLKGILVPLLANQAIYLLTQSEQDTALHEYDNLNRIMVLLIEFEEKHKFRAYYDQILHAIEKSQRGSVANGIKVDSNTLESWKIRLGNDLQKSQI
jgi:type II secretory pathway pseudopilin PulG